MANDLQRLAQEFALTPSPKAREAVTVASIPLVRSLIGRLNVPNHPLASRDDLESVGLLGVLQALDGYDPEHGTPFISYAYGRIHGALVDYLRSIDALPRERRRRLAEAQHAKEVLRQHLGREPMDHEISEHLEISISDYHRLLNDAQRRFALSLYSSTAYDSDQAALDTIPNDDALEAFEQVDQNSLHDYIAVLVRELPEREQTILALYYFENLKLREIAQILSLTEARISQILSKILATLRARLIETHALAA